MTDKKLQLKYRIWIELDNDEKKKEERRKGRKKKDTTRFIVGLGVARLLSAIKETSSLTDAAKKVGYSYKYAWDRTQKLKERLGADAVNASKGGKGGGGEMVLTNEGEEILKMYQFWDDFLEKCMEKKDEILKSGILDED